MGKRKAAQPTGEDLRTVLREETSMTLLEQERTLKRMEGRAFQHSLEGRYDLSPEMLDCIDFQTGKENQTLSFPILNLQDTWIGQNC